MTLLERRADHLVQSLLGSHRGHGHRDLRRHAVPFRAGSRRANSVVASFSVLYLATWCSAPGCVQRLGCAVSHRIVGEFRDLPSLLPFRNVKHVTRCGKFLTAIRSGHTSALTCSRMFIRRHYDPQAGHHRSSRLAILVDRDFGRRSPPRPESSVRSSIAPEARCRVRPSPSSTSAPTPSAWPTPTPKAASRCPNLPPATYTVRVELSGFATTEVKGLMLRNGEVGPADDHAGSGERVRERDRRRHVPAAPDDQRVGQPDDHARSRLKTCRSPAEACCRSPRCPQASRRRRSIAARSSAPPAAAAAST